MMRKLLQRVKCLLGYHGFSGLVYLDTRNYQSACALAIFISCGDTFIEHMNPRFHKTWYRIWVSGCPYCERRLPVTERDVPIELLSL